MSDQMQSRLPDADMQSAPRALLRAAKRAREVARRTGTAVVVIRDGVVVEEAVAESDEVREGSAATR
jgi:hypothetical protein